MFAKDAGWRMEQMRKLLGISREEMARECGTSARTIKRIEHGQQMMTAELLARVCMALGVSAYLVVSVIPKLAEFLTDAGGELPALTLLLMESSRYLRVHAPEAGVMALAAAAVWWAVRLSASGRELEDALLLKLPVAGKILRVSGTALFARSLEIMTESGVTLLDALDTCGKILSNSRMRRRAMAARDAIVAGESLERSLAPAREFMPMLRRMAAVGEVSGSLPAAFGETARFHELVLAVTIKRLGMLVEPVMIVVTGLIVGFVYIAFFMALFAIAGAA